MQDHDVTRADQRRERGGGGVGGDRVVQPRRHLGADDQRLRTAGCGLERGGVLDVEPRGHCGFAFEQMLRRHRVGEHVMGFFERVEVFGCNVASGQSLSTYRLHFAA